LQFIVTFIATIYTLVELQQYQQETKTQLIRCISRWDFTALIINVTIGAGILGLPSKVFALLGGYSLWAYGGCAILVLMLILCFAEVGSRFNGTGGPYLYTLVTLGPFAGFIAGWLWLSRMFSFASVCNLLMDYLAYLWAPAASGFPRMAAMILLVALLALINFEGIRPATLINNVITVSKLLILFVFVGAGIFVVHFPAAPTIKPISLPAFGSAVLVLIFAFSGFDVAAVPAGEVKNPGKSVPFGLFVALSVVVLLYIGIQYVCMGALPDLARSNRPIAEAAGRVMGIGGGYLVTIGALITMLGTLNVLMLTSSRLLFAMGEQHQLPHQLTFLHRRHRTPVIAICITALLLVVLSTSGSFIDALTISAVIRLFTFITTCLALILLRRKQAPAAPFTVKLGPWLAASSIVFCLALLANISSREALDAVIVTLAGVVIYWFYIIFTRLKSPVK